MGLIDFIKSAGAKIFGSEPTEDEKAEKKATGYQKSPNHVMAIPTNIM